MSPPSVFLDEDVEVPTSVAVLAMFAGTSVHQQGLAGKGVPDDTVFEHAQAFGSVFVTHNGKDFLALSTRYFEEERSHAGILIVMRRPVWRDEIKIIINALSRFNAEEWRDRVLMV